MNIGHLQWLGTDCYFTYAFIEFGRDQKCSEQGSYCMCWELTQVLTETGFQTTDSRDRQGVENVL